MKTTPALLIILDGFGYRPGGEDNAIAKARTPNWDALWETYPHTTISASEAAVGLPSGQMGNSEVGHLNMGAGRVVYQDLSRINHAITNAHFFTNPALRHTVDTVKTAGSALHIFGLLSDGGVHSLDSHIHTMLEMAAQAKLKKVYLHAFLDGRDTPPKSAETYLIRTEETMRALNTGRITTICGRYYAMDRDKRWERVKEAYNALTTGKSPFTAVTAIAGLHQAYARNETDEFVKPTLIAPPGEHPVRIQDGDAVVFMNFRADRAREITRAFIEETFTGFERATHPHLAAFCTLTRYHDDFKVNVAFPSERIKNCLGEYLSNLGLHQLRIAETEKYAHVTFFFNGGEETPFPGEDRTLVSSPRVATYDLKPEMSAYEVTDKLVGAIRGRKYDAIICNYANGDMVGHTGILSATIRAVEVLDECLARAVKAMQENGGEILITADHGNAEKMFDEKTQHPHTAHTLYNVPFIYIGRPARMAATGALEDVAPTMLRMMGLDQPPEMTGKPLIEFEQG